MSRYYPRAEMVKNMLQDGDKDTVHHHSAPTLSVRVLGTSDLHACLTSWDYSTQKNIPNRGLSRVSTLISRAREQAQNCLLFDNGDFLAGSGLGDYMAAQGEAAAPHPMVLAMNHLGYDAVNLGNHEFSHGLPFLRSALHHATFPLIASNFHFTDLPCAQKWLLLKRDLRDADGAIHPVTIGVFGVMPSQTLMWEASHLNGKARAQPMLDTARTMAQMLHDKGADIIIALAHSGMPSDQQTSISEETMAQAIADIPHIDAVIAGHSHKVFPTDADEQTQGNIALPGFFGSHLAVIDLQLHRRAGKWQAVHARAQTWPTGLRDTLTGQLYPVAEDDPAIMRFNDAAHAQIIGDLDEVIGTAPQRLHTYFSLVRPCAALSLIADVQATALKAALAGGPYEGLPILSAVAPFKAGGRGGAENYTDFPAGPMRQRHAADLYLHPNTLVGFRITGAEVKTWLERAASLFAQIAPNSLDADLINADFPSFNFDIMFGVTYQIDLSQPAMFDTRGVCLNSSAQRIVNLRYNGADVMPDQQFIVASNSYRRDTCTGFLATHAGNVIYEGDTLIQKLLRDYLMQGAPAMPAPAAAPWGFAPAEGATVILRSGPIAAQVLGDIAQYRPHILGLDTAGFQRFRLHL
jgi:2',3'-cyclic-nucleotide 2'-phosphodiesterase / 3'-nucleotidase